MRILVLEDELSPRGGQELSLVSVCEALSRRGHEIILLYKSGGSLEARYRAFCSRLIRAGAYSIDHRNFSGSVAGFFGALARSCAARPGLIYANQYQDSLLAGCVSFFCGAPFVCHLRIPSPKRFCNQHRLGLSMVNRLIVISKNMRSDWERHASLRGRLELVYNGIDAGIYPFSDDPRPARRRLGIPEGATVIMYAGRVHPLKGVDMLADTFMELKMRIPNLFLVVVGREFDIRDFISDLKALLEKRGFADSALWIPHTDDMPGLYAASDLAVLPSRWPEPFGRTLIESMACGTPSIGSDAGGIPEVLTGEFRKFVFPAGDTRALTALVERAIGWRQSDPELGRRARAHVERNFSLEKTVDGVEAVFRKAGGR